MTIEKADSFEWSAAEPLARARTEKVNPNTALHDYYLMGPDRSLRKLCERYRAVGPDGPAPPTRRMTTLRRWSVRYHWQARVEAETDLENGRRRQRRQRWREQVDDEDWSLGGELRQLARQILEQGPTYLKTQRRFIRGAKEQIEGADGKTYTVSVEPDREIITVGLNLPIAIRAAKLASDMQRGAAGVGRRSAYETWNIDLQELTTSQLTRLAAGEDLVDVLLTSAGEGGADQTPEVG